MNTVRMIVATLVVALALVAATSAYGAATPVATATQIDNNTYLLDASTSPCKWRYCTFSWRHYGPGTNRLGATVGFGPTLVAVFTKPGFYPIVVTESEFCSATSSTSCPGTAQVGVRVN